jgi:hypothetical protein
VQKIGEKMTEFEKWKEKSEFYKILPIAMMETYSSYLKPGND